MNARQRLIEASRAAQRADDHIVTVYQVLRRLYGRSAYTATIAEDGTVCWTFAETVPYDVREQVKTAESRQREAYNKLQSAIADYALETSP